MAKIELIDCEVIEHIDHIDHIGKDSYSVLIAEGTVEVDGVEYGFKYTKHRNIDNGGSGVEITDDKEIDDELHDDLVDYIENNIDEWLEG